ncbi:hypothetical protein J3R30DRAFT_3701405 [Lentinula aciculospora]|uniref:Uncharacterized protein n=1 Tax=Lentinula aciculospora TaxID=153920 RepID=A0A9W9AE56_9AGAR|nr:hypothetical protein J3R30DRAFT_3701405 [Lentinula aciculospora]
MLSYSHAFPKLQPHVVEMPYSPPIEQNTPTWHSEYETLPESDLCTCTPGGEHRCWEVDYEVYGVIHNNDAGCMTCNDFASHIHHARRQGVRGIEEAYAKMHQRHDILWRRGLKEGIRRDPSIATSDGQLLEQLNVAQIEQAKAEEELKHLTQVVLGQISLVEFLSIFTHPTFATREQFRLSLSCAAANVTKSLWNEDVNVKVEDLILVQDSSLRRVASDPQLHKFFPNVSVLPRPAPAEASLRRKTHTSSQVPEDNDISGLSSSRAATPRPSPSPEKSTSSHHTPVPCRPGEDILGYYDSNPRTADMRQTLNTLFNVAHAGDVNALAKCKALCREAHMQGVSARTSGMRYVLKYWKKPPANANSSSQSNVDSSSSRSTRRETGSRHEDRHQRNDVAAASSISSVVSTSSDTGRISLLNPKITDPPETWFQYLKAHSLSWPNGVRKESNGDPWMADLVASRMFARLRPPNKSDVTKHARNQFTASTISLFTDRGRYKSLVRWLGLRISSVANYVPFVDPSGGLGTVSEEDVARHYASCGVTVEEVETEVEGWAIQFKRERDERNYST